mgnify:CR=1 FL=1
MLIHLEKLGKSFGEKVVLHDVTASVEREDRIGIVGQNGAGKTTLLKILTGEYQDYEGEFSVTHGVTLGYLEQNAKLDATLDLYGEMRSTFAPVLDAMAQMQVLERKMAAQPDDTELLARIKKGVTGEEAVAAGQKVVRCGMKLSMMVIAGLGGKDGSERHAVETGKAVTAIQPNMLSVLTLRLYKGTEMLRQFEAGEFELLSPAGLAREVHTMLEHVEIRPGNHTLFRSNHISNYVPLAGTLPQDRDRLLRELEVSMEKLSKLTDWEVYTNMEY